MWSSVINDLFFKLQIAGGTSRAIPVGFDTSVMAAVANGESSAVKFFNQWVDDVKENVPEDRLLIHEAREGWGPLCKFLDVPVPTNPYPRVNDTKIMKTRITITKFMSYGIFVVLPIIISVMMVWKKVF